MGSYDTGECSPPERRRYDPIEPVMPSVARHDNGHIDQRIEEAMRHGVRAGGAYDPEYKTIVSLGGGLTPSRIVQPMPDDIKEGSIREAVKYLTSDEIAGQENRSIVDAVRTRMARPDYRLIINGALNLGNDKLERRISEYTQLKTHTDEEGERNFNYLDIAIVTHDEGGNKPYSLDSRL